MCFCPLTVDSSHDKEITRRISLTASWLEVLNYGVILPWGDPGQCLETVLVVIDGEGCSWPHMGRNWDAGRHPPVNRSPLQQRMIQPKTSVFLSLRSPGLDELFRSQIIYKTNQAFQL